MLKRFDILKLNYKSEIVIVVSMTKYEFEN